MAVSTPVPIRVLLFVLAALMGLGGLVMIVSSRSLIMLLFLYPPESEVTTLTLAVVKEIGGMALLFGLLLFFAARDPIRNIAIVDAFIVGLVILSITPLLSLETLDLPFYPPYLLWMRSVVRLALAVILYMLRPRVDRTRAA